MPIPLAPPETRGHIRRDIAILIIVAIILCCLLLFFAIGGYFFYNQYTETQAISGTATSAYMATKIKQDTEIQATQQAEANATAQALAIQATATSEAFSMQATATAQALEVQATATAQALEVQATATAQAKMAELMTYRHFDSFDNNDNEWRSREEEDNEFWAGSTTIQNGIYSWNVTEAKQTFVSWADFNSSETLRNFDVTLKARRQSGLPAEFCYGLLFRKSEDGFSAGSYIISICENGYFKISYYDGDVLWETIQDWTETSVINEDDWNLLEVSGRGSNFTITINNQQVAQFSDDRLEEGLVSIFIDVYEVSAGRIEFDFFALQPR